VGCHDGDIRIWDRPTESADGHVLPEGWLGREHVGSLAFGDGGRFLAWADWAGTVRIRDLTWPASERTRVFVSDGDGPASVAFLPDGGVLASSSQDGTVRMWHIDRPNSPPIVLRGKLGGQLLFVYTSAIAFSPDGKWLASGSRSGRIHLRMARTSDLAELVCQKVARNLTRDEWDQFVGAGIVYESTCSDLPPGDGIQTADSSH
jgi:WD40 repeat protein